MATIFTESPNSAAAHPNAPSTLKDPGRNLGHVLPISSLRFVFAIWVVLGHYGVPLLTQPQHSKLLWGLRALLWCLFNGPAAVILFFIISGFCIHFPNRFGLAVKSWRMYYARRYLRILIPMTVAIAISIPLHMHFGLLTDSILWSLLCEEIYYLIYPFLLMAKNRIGWQGLMAISWILSYLIVLTNPHALGYAAFGSGLNWIVGLPCWLLGCKLAENYDTLDPAPVSKLNIWAWRGSALGISVILRVLQFHTPIHNPWSLNLFAVFGFFWMTQEIRYYRNGASKPLFEGLGEASYSIYLTHTHAIAAFAMIPIAATLPYAARWGATVALCIAMTTAFYWLVERPSHRFARRYAKRAAWLQR